MLNIQYIDYKKWCAEQHANTNHLYDGYLPYEFHLRMVAANFYRFKDLLSWRIHDDVEMACWGHDLIEDTRLTFNDVKEVLSYEATLIVYALTNEKGRNRKERANDKYYNGIKETNGAIFVKMCDRIANVEYGKMTGSKMFDMYKKENPSFIQMLHTAKTLKELKQMTDYLDSLFM